MDPSVYLLYGLFAFFVLLLCGALFAPVRRLLLFLLRAACGVGALVAANAIALALGLPALGINPFSAAACALCGPAGVALLLLLGWASV